MKTVTIEDPREVVEMLKIEYPRHTRIEANYCEKGWRIIVHMAGTNCPPGGIGQTLETALAMLQVRMDACDPIKKLRSQADDYGYRIVKKKEPVEAR